MITSSSSVTTGTVNWARVTTDEQIVILTVFEIRDSSGNLISRVGVPGSADTLGNAVIPRLRDVAKGIQTAFAVVNAGLFDVTVTATLYSDSAQGEVFVGNLPDLPRRSAEPIAQAMFPLAGGNQTAQFFNQLFAPLNDPDGTNYNHVVFESTAPTLGGTALVFEGTNQATFPVNRLDGSPASSVATALKPREGGYPGQLMMVSYNCQPKIRTLVLFLEGSFEVGVTNNGSSIMGTGKFDIPVDFEDYAGAGTIKLSAGISGTGELIGATFEVTYASERGDEKTGSGSGTAVGTIDSFRTEDLFNMDVTFTGTDVGRSLDSGVDKSTCDFAATFLQKPPDD